jgi:hypothetical protein
LRAPPDFIFLRAFSRFVVEEATLFFGTNARLLGFELPYLLKFGLVCGGSRLKLSFKLGAARVFHRVHATQFFFDPLQFFFSNASPRFFGRVFARFRLDPQLLLLCTSQSRLFLLLSPASGFLMERVFRGETRSLELSTSRIFFISQARQLGFELVYFFANGRWRARRFLLRRSRQRCGRSRADWRRRRWCDRLRARWRRSS